MIRILYVGNINDNLNQKWMRPFADSLDFQLMVMPETPLDATATEFVQSKGIEVLLDTLPGRDLFRLLTSFWYLTTLSFSKRIDVVHLFYGDWKLPLGLARVWCHMPMILTTRGSDANVQLPELFARRSFKAAVFKKLSAWGLARLDLLTCTSLSQLRSLKSLFTKLPPFELIRTGVDVAAVESDTSSSLPEALNRVERFILFPRLMRPVYNHEFALEALSRITNRERQGVFYVFLDKDSSDTGYVRSVRQRIEAIGDEAFVWLPYLSPEALFECYKRSELVVMTPRSDGSPVSALEAMLCGTPLVLPPLDYDDDLYEGIYKLKNWEPEELAEVLKSVINGDYGPFRPDRARAVVLGSADSRLEMVKLARCYARLCSGRAGAA